MRRGWASAYPPKSNFIGLRLKQETAPSALTRGGTGPPIKIEDNARVREFASDVRTGLAKPQKELHSKYLYDELGSSLFESITHLPEYGLTRADERLLRLNAGQIASLLPSPVAVIELGSGVGKKTQHLLRAIGGRPLRYYPI